MITIRILAIMFLVACAGKSEPQPQTPISNQAPPTANPAVEPTPTRTLPDCDAIEDASCAMRIVQYFSTDMCDCKDKACADKVNDAFTKWGSEMARQATKAKPMHPDPELAKTMTDVMMRYSDCYTKLAMAADQNTGSGGTP